jgi:hypothetical protein
MTDPEPDIAGYAEAQALLRAKFGRPVPFFTPTPTTWPEGHPTDSQGRPLDPTVLPLASGFASGVVNCNVAAKTATGDLSAPIEDGPLGAIDHRSLILIMDEPDFAAIAAATECEVFGSRYKVADDQPDQVGGADPQRHLIFVEKM